MASWYKGLISNASTNISKLQRTYFGGESDGDTEDDTHVCRVLRNYYTEKGQPFPGWLPPDPKAPPPQQPIYAQQPGQQIGSRYGGLSAPVGGGGSLSSLWDNNNNANSRPGPGGLLARSPDPRNPFASRGGGGSERDDYQRSASYQQRSPAASYGEGPTPPAGSTSSAQEKLKQRLWGAARSASASPAGSGPFQPPVQQQQQTPQSGGGRWGGNSGGGGGDYEDRFAPAGAYGGQGGASEQPPVMSANAPWSSSGEQDYRGGAASAGRRVGLPSGPRRGGGLPSNPRMR
ncbi:Sec1-binding region of Mso1-domain-containing protein [Lasiosphaeria ovina]|uniref:Sec1-binding region of Mso1-domain-containing protein n=1 Tax=Lasiosphaeria ovina TaxID=92902 RepID=A0AAE0JX55_9PEZI|nr:Sec1-binding region of Mso1-domain-containing protein [Lasiosphaeria ovina]